MPFFLWSSLASGQVESTSGRRADSVRATQLDTVVVTPERSATTAHASTVALTVLTGSVLRQLPVKSVASALVLAPGVAVVDANSVCGNPRLIVRGFYGGGETDYLAALLDGVPIAALGSGAVDWDMLPRSAIARLELLRGGASYVRGDAALAGALNLVADKSAPFTWRTAGGAYDFRDATVAGGAGRGDDRFDMGLDYQTSEGFRAHEQRSASTLSAKFSHHGDTRSFAGFVSTHSRDFEDPGPLPSTTDDDRAANSFFRFDRSEEKVHRAGVNVVQTLGQIAASAYVVGEYATASQFKTLPLSPDFGDTKQRLTEAPRLFGSTQFELGDDSPRSFGRVVTGIDASIGRLKSRYADVVSGDQSAYISSGGDPHAPRPWSTTRRGTVAGFATWQIRPVSPLRIVLSSRFDHLRDSFDPSASGSASTSASHNAFSPKAAFNIALPSTPKSATNVYASVSRVFKAPTLDQLFDERAIPIPFPPFSATVSNAALVPQRGTALEGGVVETWQITSGTHLDVTGAAYRERMRDELDFDVSSFRYVNLGRSLHRGIELGGTLAGDDGWLVTGSVARQHVVAEAGEFSGRQLKAIPRRIASFGATVPLTRGFTVGLVASSLGGAFIDDANEQPLAGYTRADVRLGIPVGRVRLTVDAMNVFDRRYDSTAFPDPAGTGVVYRYPAARRGLVFGIESR